MLAMRLTIFDNLIDISRLDELKGIERATAICGSVRQPPTLSSASTTRSAVPLLTRATPYIGHFQIRTRGTLGGAIAHADPAGGVSGGGVGARRGDGSRLTEGRRQIPAAEFFTGLWETAWQQTKSSTAVRFPVWRGRCGFAVEEFARRHGDFAIAGAVVAVELDDDDRVSPLRHRASGPGLDAAARSAAEEAVVGRPVSDMTADEIGELAMAGLDDIPADLQGSVSYRTRVGATMVARAWTAAIREATTEAINA